MAPRGYGYHVLNRANGRSPVFRNDGENAAVVSRAIGLRWSWRRRGAAGSAVQVRGLFVPDRRAAGSGESSPAARAAAAATGRKRSRHPFPTAQSSGIPIDTRIESVALVAEARRDLRRAGGTPPRPSSLSAHSRVLESGPVNPSPVAAERVRSQESRRSNRSFYGGWSCFRNASCW
jgi:hypothetical protein